MRQSRLAAPVWAILLALAFLFRLVYGLSSIFWTEDERQVYLIGLLSYARGEWPYFGADVVWTGSRLPGALQAKLIEWPLVLWPVPEAPFVLLNLLSFASLTLLAWYIARRLPEVPRWLVWSALFTLPWTLNFSTHIVNTSYILPGAIVFFVGFFEGAPTFRGDLLPRTLAWTLMGAGLLFLAQIHMSWVLLPPYVMYAAIDLLRHDRRMAPRAAAAMLVGAAATGSLLVPTILEFGLRAGGIDRTVEFHAQRPDMLLTIAARFLSFVSLETNRFLGLSTAERLLFLWRQPWVVLPVLVATVVGLVSPVLLALGWFRSSAADPLWQRTRWLVLATLLWIYTSFFFSVRGPLAHAFYVVFPIAVLYAALAWRVWVASSPRAILYERLAAVSLVAGVLMHAGLAIDRFPRQSLYRDRALVQAAITQKNDRFLGDRRALEVSGELRTSEPGADAAAYLAADPVTDLEIVSAVWSPVLGGRVSRIPTTISNRGSAAAYLEIWFETTYRDAGGQVVATREGTIREILEPGEGRTWPDLTDGMAPPGAATASMRIIGAQKAVPARAP